MKKIFLFTIIFLAKASFAQSKLVTKWNPYTKTYETTYEESIYDIQARRRAEESRRIQQSYDESDRRYNEALLNYSNYKNQQSQQNQQTAYNNSRYLSKIANDLNNSINYLKLNCLFTVDLESKYNEYLGSKTMVNFLDFNEVENAAKRLNHYLSYFSNYPCKK